MVGNRCRSRPSVRSSEEVAVEVLCLSSGSRGVHLKATATTRRQAWTLRYSQVGRRRRQPGLTIVPALSHPSKAFRTLLFDVELILQRRICPPLATPA